MYTVTFYSYKGGVGRTMALVNVATILAQKGKRVLVVDFDLEAPSLPNYGFLSEAKVERGLVDYISEYRETSVAPDVADYIYRCEGLDSEVYLMPAGDASTVEYSRKLASIDWQRLYDLEKGYLLFEDLKQQWQRLDGRGFDYVLIDSRTGHTDVGGICTRQLPDLVVPMFLPTMQNIKGLEPIIEEVRVDPSRSRRPIEFSFCASNVPDLDDEQQILSERLNEASERLGYEQDKLSIVHHYGSLHVLSHAIFVQDRPNSRLSKEYHNLAKRIISHNYEDATGGYLALRGIQEAIRRDPRSKAMQARDEIASKVDRVFSLHPHDPKIAFIVSRIRSAIGDLEGEIAALTVAINMGDESTKLRGLRARAYQAINMTELSVADLRYVLRQQNATGAEITAALRMLERTDNKYDEEIEQLLDRTDLSLSAINAIAEVAQRNRRHLRKFWEQLIRALDRDEPPGKELDYAKHHLWLALIGCGQFQKAVELISTDPDSSTLQLPGQFNLFVAKWGAYGEPDLSMASELMSRMLGSEALRDANFVQCRGVLNAVLGSKDAALNDLLLADQLAASQRVRNFSCASYLYVDVEQFAKDNSSLRQTIQSSRLGSLPFFRS